MSRLLINEPPLMVLPSLAVEIGLNQALILQQIHYWLGAQRDEIEGEKWVYNTILQWREQFPFFSEDTICRALKSLRDGGYIIAKNLSSNPFNKTLYYRIDYRKLRVSDDRNLRVSDVADCGNLYYTETTNRDYSDTNGKKKTPSASVSKQDDPIFEEAWAAYPKRPNNSKAAALKAWTARVKNGVDPADMILGVKRYAKYCEVMRTEPNFIKQASTFFGPDQHYLNEFDAKPSTGRPAPMTLLEHNQQSAREALEIIRASRT